MRGEQGEVPRPRDAKQFGAEVPRNLLSVQYAEHFHQHPVGVQGALAAFQQTPTVLQASNCLTSGEFPAQCPPRPVPFHRSAVSHGGHPGAGRGFPGTSQLPCGSGCHGEEGGAEQ